MKKIFHMTSIQHSCCKEIPCQSFVIDTAYEFLAGLFKCYMYHPYLKVSPVTLRDGENLAVS